MNRTYSQEIAEVIHQYLTEDDWNFQFNEESGIFQFNLSLSGPVKSVRYVIDVREDYYLVYGFSPLGADPKNRREMVRIAEFLTRVNYGLKQGCFEMDWRDGEIRYRIYQDCEQMTLSKKAVQNNIYCLAITFERYASGLTSLLFTGTEPEAAVRRCERNMQEELHRLEQAFQESLSGLEEEEAPEGLENLEDLGDLDDTEEDFGLEELEEDEEDGQEEADGSTPLVVRPILFGEGGE